MAKTITELTTAGAATLATDLIWVEQGSAPFKMTLLALQTAMGITAEVNDLSSVVTWANVPDGFITESSVTQHEAALTILESQITDGTILTRRAGTEAISGSWTWSVPILSTTTSATGGFSYSPAGSAVRAGSYVSLSRLFSSARFALANNAYADPGDAVSGQMRYAVTHGSYGHTIYEGAAGVHYWYGESASVTAGNVVTKVLQMDLDATGNLTVVGDVDAVEVTATAVTSGLTNGLNVISNGPAIYFSESDQGVGSKGWKFYASAGAFQFYTTNDSGSAIHRCLRFTRSGTTNDAVELYSQGTLEAHTQDHNASGNTTGLQVKDYGGTMRDAGLATMETITFTANTVVAADHWSQKCLEHTNATTHTLTFNTLSTVPDGAVMWVKATTGIVTLVDGTMVLSWYDGSSVTTGNRTLAVGGWATIHKTGDSAADVTGVGLS